jgi:hypothetical protein
MRSLLLTLIVAGSSGLMAGCQGPSEPVQPGTRRQAVVGSPPSGIEWVGGTVPATGLPPGAVRHANPVPPELQWPPPPQVVQAAREKQYEESLALAEQQWQAEGLSEEEVARRREKLQRAMLGDGQGR